MVSAGLVDGSNGSGKVFSAVRRVVDQCRAWTHTSWWSVCHVYPFGSRIRAR